jgi:hypothetical protein
MGSVPGTAQSDSWVEGLIENMTRRLLLGTGLNVTSFVELTDQRHFGKGYFTNAFIHFYGIIVSYSFPQPFVANNTPPNADAQSSPRLCDCLRLLSQTANRLVKCIDQL